MRKEEFLNYPLDLKLIREIAFTEIEDVEEHDNFLVELFLKTLYYYSKLDKKAVNITATPISFSDFISTFLNNLLDRNTDLLDALFILFKSDSGKDKNFEETYNLFYSELNGRKRIYNEELETVIRNAGAKISKYYMDLE